MSHFSCMAWKHHRFFGRSEVTWTSWAFYHSTVVRYSPGDEMRNMRTNRSRQRRRQIGKETHLPKCLWMGYASLVLGGGNSNIFYFHPYLGKIPNLTHIFQMGWNHQLELFYCLNHLFFFHIIVKTESFQSRQELSLILSSQARNWITPWRWNLFEETRQQKHHMEDPTWYNIHVVFWWCEIYTGNSGFWILMLFLESAW